MEGSLPAAAAAAAYISCGGVVGGCVYGPHRKLGIRGAEEEVIGIK